MLWSRSLLFVALVAMTSASAHGFQETVPETSAAPAQSGDPAMSGDDSPLGLAPDDEAETGGSGSASGLGLPSLDFGLELLYGGRPAPTTGSPDEGDAGVTGRLKHSF
jgi:hypothetical protein